MLAARLHGFGRAQDVLKVEQLPEPVPGSGEVAIEMLYAPINPADLNIIEGKYGELPELPALIGNEGVGRVRSLGPDVTELQVGDIVLPMTRQCWSRTIIADAASVVVLPPGVELRQASMLAVNPLTAWAMLKEFGHLQPGDWVVQNAANSAVGRCMIQLARHWGLKTLNVVRREELIEELGQLGADRTILEGADLRQEAERFCDGKRPRLALNSVGGASALNLANALQDGGEIVTYGAMGKQPVKIPNGLLIFRNLEFKGFWLLRWKERVSRETFDQAIRDLAGMVIDGRLHLPIHCTFGLSEIAAAVDEAAGEKRSGKVLIDLQR